MERYLPAATWIAFAGVAYILWPLVFRARYGRSPYAGGFPPRNLYDWTDVFLAATLIGYTAWLLLAPVGKPMSIAAGLGVWAAGCALRAWAVAALGPNWRIGHDADDRATVFVQHGPYRYFDHPINTALVLVAIGQAFMTGLDPRALLLLAGATIYFIIQSRAEDRLWRERMAAESGGADEPGAQGSASRREDGAA